MASVLPALPFLSHCDLYCGIDHILGPVILFMKSHPTASRVESHILTCAGFESYRSLTINPNSTLYEAVNHLPGVQQASEVYRGIAVTIMKYFSEMPSRLQWECQQHSIRNECLGIGKYDMGSVLPVAFNEVHAAELASRLQKVVSDRTIMDLAVAYGEKSLSSYEMDVVVQGGTYTAAEELPPPITRILGQLGGETVMPSSKLKRTTSRHGQHTRQKSSVEYSSEMLERELKELVETERNYVSKLHSLLAEVVEPIRNGSRLNTYPSFPSQQELPNLFPTCLDKIYRTNSEFAVAVENALHAEGIFGVAKCCLQFRRENQQFPKFKSSYQAYISSSSKFPQLLNKFSKDKNSGFYKIVEQTGEQKLRSLLIEPVQRLPRYTLYIDNFLNFLDPNDPAASPFGLAREIITDICALQSSDSAERTQTTKRLQAMIPSWPLNLKPAGRLITAVDFFDIMPPYNIATSEYLASILLLFPDGIAILRRPKTSTLLARGIIAEVDRPSNMRTPTTSKREGLDLVFAGWCDLKDLIFFEAELGSVIWMTNMQDFRDGWGTNRDAEAGLKKLTLMNAYEGRASRFIEEVVLARLESRCGNNQKGVVGVRVQENAPFKIWSCVWGNEFEGYRESTGKGKSSCVVFLGDSPGSLEGGLDGELDDGVSIVVGIEAYSKHELKLIIRTDAENLNSSELVADFKLYETLAERLLHIIQKQNIPGYPSRITPILLDANAKLLRSLNLPYEGETRRKLRPPSPVKVLSSLFSSGSSTVPGSNNSTPARMAKPVLLMGDRTVLTPSPAPSREDPVEPKQKITLIRAEETNGLSTFSRLEKVFESYLEGLRHSTADGSMNILHTENIQGSLVEYAFLTVPNDPSILRDLPAPVIYEAFSRFLKTEWTSHMGVLLGQHHLDQLREAFESQRRVDFEDQFMHFLIEMAPQNRRAFKNIILLIHELSMQYDASVMDQVILAFTDLFHLDNPTSASHPYIKLMIYLSQNVEMLFNDTPQHLSVESTPCSDVGVRRANTVNTPSSLNSNSSTKKKFTLSSVYGSIRGDHYHLEKPRSGESEGLVASFMRTLSKREKFKIPSHKSLDDEGKILKRPGSRENKPTIVNGFTTTQASPSLESIMGSPNMKPEVPNATATPPILHSRKKKRRSSLSDLKVVLHETGAELSQIAVKRGSVFVTSNKNPTLLPEVQKLSAFPFPKALDDADYSPNQTPVRKISLNNDISVRKGSSNEAPIRRGSGKLSGVPNPTETTPKTSSPPKRTPPSREFKSRRDTTPTLDCPTPELKRPATSSSREARPTVSSARDPPRTRTRAQSTRKAQDQLSHERTLHEESSYKAQNEDDARIVRRSRPTLRPGSSSMSTISTTTNDSFVNIASEEELRKELSELRTKYRNMETDMEKKMLQKDEQLQALNVAFARKDEELRKKDEELKALHRRYGEALARRDSQIAKRDAELREVNRLYESVNAEHDVLYDKINEELHKIEKAAQGRMDANLFKIIDENKLETSKLRKEIGRLRKENVVLNARLQQQPTPS